MVTLRQRLSGSAVMVATLFSSFSGFAFMPMTAQAVNYNCPKLSAGQYVSFQGKISLLTDESRASFVSTDAFLTWEANTAKVKKIKYDVCLASYPESGTIMYRPGSKLVKDPSGTIYAVDIGKLREISPKVAKALYGSNWKSLVKKVSSDVVTMYGGGGNELETAVPHDGMFVKVKGESGTWYVQDGKLNVLKGKLPKFLSRDIHTVPASAVTDLPVSSDYFTAAAFKVRADDISGASEGTSTPTNNDTSTSVEPTSSSKPESTSAEKTDNTKTDTKSGTINKGLFHNANYTGPFPAPEGKVLLGTYGEDKFWEPTGSGDYRFRVQTAWEREVQCIDGSRTIDKSQGKTWEKGFWSGFNVAASVVKQIDPVFDDTPKGDGKGGSLYDTGYRAGYAYRWGGGTEPRFGCPPKDGSVDLTQYDADGWRKYQNNDKLKTIKTFYSPAVASGVSESTQSALGSEGTSLNLDNYIDAIEKSSFNNKKTPMNLNRIDFLESELSAEELALGPEGIMKALYDQQKAAIQKKYANTVAFIYAEPTIETQTYGKNKITVLQYVTAHDGKWNLSNYGLRIDPKTNVGLLFFYYNPKDISNEAKNGIDVAKASSDFLAQFLTKLEFANY